MSRFRRLNIIDHSPSSFFFDESSLFAPPNPFSPYPFTSLQNDVVDFTLDLLSPSKCLLEIASPFHDFDTISDLIQIENTPLCTTTTRRVKHHRVDRVRLANELYLQSLNDRVAALELGVDKLVCERKPKIGERKYTWTTEIKSPEKNGLDRKYKWTTEVKDGKKKGVPLDKSYTFTAEIKGKGEDSPIKRTYKFEASTGNAGEDSDSSVSEKKEKKKKKKKPEKAVGAARVVEITDASDHGAIVLRQAFARRVEKIKGKKKELSPQDAAILIQISFRAYLIRRSQALRALRELAIAKSKLKELRALFNNFSYRRCVSRDAEERQRFSEKIIVLLLTVDAIEGADIMVRAAKKSMIDELEAMLDVVDPQPAGRSFSMRRRTFDMPDGLIQKELAASVAQVVQMLDQEASGSSE